MGNLSFVTFRTPISALNPNQILMIDLSLSMLLQPIDIKKLIGPSTTMSGGYFNNYTYLNIADRNSWVRRSQILGIIIF